MIYRRSVILIITLLSFVLLHAQVQKGKASYYSKRATGARTSSGERLHHDSLTCAHRTYPFGTKLKVTNLSNDKSVVVRVTDRGPYIRGRIIDLSWGAAKELGMLSKGVQMVAVELVDDYIVPFKPNEEKTVPEIDFGSSDYEFPLSESAKDAKGTEKEKKPVDGKGQKSTPTVPVKE